MAKVVFLIVGCQRSGTTMIESVLDAHPLVRVIGEEKGASYLYFDEPWKLEDFPEDFIGLRIPAATHLVREAAQAHVGAKVLFAVRDHRDVVTSMLKLKNRNVDSGLYTSWLEEYAQSELENCLTHLPSKSIVTEKLLPLRSSNAGPNDVRFGGLCWLVKNRFLPLYQQSALPTHVVRYEEFARNPETSIREVCDFLKLEWHKNLTEHYKFSSGLWGGTDKGAPIHQRSVAAYRGSLTLDQRKSLYSAIGGAMKALGYQELLDA